MKLQPEFMMRFLVGTVFSICTIRKHTTFW